MSEAGKITIILGSQWGDEGKGKLTDILCPKAEICARAAGGHNAANGVSYSFHLLPSGLINPKCLNFIGTSVVFHVPSFFKELKELEAKGLTGVRDRIKVSDRAQVNLDLHAAVDGLEEVELGTRAIGTTGRGIGPSYATKAARSGIRVHDILDEEKVQSHDPPACRRLQEALRRMFLTPHPYSSFSEMPPLMSIYDLLKYDVEEEISRFNDYRKELKKYMVDGITFMNDVVKANKNILIEGANALMLDIDYGSYPYVTSSNAGLGGVITGLALNPFKITEVVGVVKAYTTRVGGGPFPTEDNGEAGTKLQEIGRECCDRGVSTGRKRRCGWLDLVVVKYSSSVNHYTSLNLTKLDCLDTFEEIRVAVGYRDPKTGEELDSFPASLEFLEKVEVIYKSFKGWQKPTTNAKTFEDLPQEAREYVEFIEGFVGVKVKWIGTGPDREAMIVRGA
ncbi:putative adenylosuccinate synthase [Apiospora rasikravindrae]|uniref:Adenylosuccinate synthetase n=1 Tax=Apiospora rasikravindrae TaxID=990691 RepID=A0ABR1S3L5_9PEZI